MNRRDILEKFFIEFKDVEGLMNDSVILQFITEKIREYIENHSQKEMLSFRIDQMYLLRNATEEIKTRNAELLSRISDGRDEYYVNELNEEEKIQYSNFILYYPEFDVYYALYYLGDTHFRIEHLYADDASKIQAFTKDLLEREKRGKKDCVTFISDTPNGQHEETKKINNILADEEIYMDEKTKEEIYLSLDAFFNEDRSFFKEYGIPFKRGILLYGSPGNGKTSIIKNIASKSEHPVIYYQISEYTNSSSLQEAFNKAYNIAPAILVMEDIDGLPEKVRSSFLNILDGATSSEGIFLIGTTNYPERVDTALMNRAGRFDQVFEVSLPSLDMRRKYLFHTKLINFLKTEDIELAAKMSEGFSIVQLKEVYTNIVLRKRSGKEIIVKEIVAHIAGNNRKKETGKWQKQEEKIGF